MACCRLRRPDTRENAALPEELDGAIEDYKVLLYNNVFDKKDRVESFFTLSD